MTKAITQNGFKISFPSSFNGYKVLDLIGCGTTCVVVSVEKQKTKEIYSAKIISKEDAQKRKMLHIVKNEIEILKKLDHPNIIKIYESFEIQNENGDKLLIIITEYCSKGSLVDYIIDRKLKNEYQKNKIILSLLSAVKYIHSKGIAHHDIKPDNVLLDEDLNPKLCDFGFSVESVIGDQSTKGGTVRYAAPELYKKGIYNTLKVDIYAIGVSIYGIHAGMYPYRDGSERSAMMQTLRGDLNIGSEIDGKLRQLLLKCTHLIPSKRPSIDDIIKDKYFTEAFLHQFIDEAFPYIKVHIQNCCKIVNEAIFKLYENLVILNNLKESNKGSNTILNGRLALMEKILHLHITKYCKDKSVFKIKGNQYIKKELDRMHENRFYNNNNESMFKKGKRYFENFKRDKLKYDKNYYKVLENRNSYW